MEAERIAAALRHQQGLDAARSSPTVRKMLPSAWFDSELSPTDGLGGQMPDESLRNRLLAGLQHQEQWSTKAQPLAWTQQQKDQMTHGYPTPDEIWANEHPKHQPEEPGDFVLAQTGSPLLATAAHSLQPKNIMKGLGDWSTYVGDKAISGGFELGPRIGGGNRVMNQAAGATLASLAADPSNLLGTGSKAGIGIGALGGVIKKLADKPGSTAALLSALKAQKAGADSGIGASAVALAKTMKAADHTDEAILQATAKLGGGKPPKKNALQSLRDIPTADAIDIARKEPHLNLSNAGAEGYYIGGPRDVKSYKDMESVRTLFDDFIARDPRGADWYDRYRAGMDDVTGGNKLFNKWMASQEGMWSAGVSPGAELNFALVENNGTLTGFRVKSGRPGPHKAHNDAADANDVSKYWLGPKTGVYANKINPQTTSKDTATGVNDFRFARAWQYTEPSGIQQTGGLNKAQHAFMDHETALAVDRANRISLGGRSDWTGEKLQAAPWVRQKADDLFGKGTAYRKRALEQMKYHQVNDLSPEAVEDVAREMAFQDANRTIADFFDKHTVNATYETFPGPGTGHLPGLTGASDKVKEAIHADPKSTFATAPGGRDSIYSGLQYNDTGIAARVRPTVQSQGIYQPTTGPLEMNPGEVARPLAGIETIDPIAYNLPEGLFGPVGTRPGVKRMQPGDRAMVDASETFRAGLSGQDAGAGHMVLGGGRPMDQNSLRIPMDRKLTKSELKKTRNALSKYGLDDVVDTGRGVTGTRFWPPPDEMKPKQVKALALAVRDVLPDAGQGQRAHVDAVYSDLTDVIQPDGTRINAWMAGEGSGEVSKEILRKINITPEMRKAFDNNPFIAENAQNYIARDESLAKQFATTIRADLQRLRAIVAEGPGWVGRLEAAVKKGGLVPAVAAAFLGAAYATSIPGEDQSGI